jgi:hypothetical protein
VICLKNERYYYTLMSPAEKSVYKIIYTGLCSRNSAVRFSSVVSPERIGEIYRLVLYDNPLMYYVNQRVIKMSGGVGSYILLPEYLYSANEIKNINKDIHRVMQKIDAKAHTMTDNCFRLEKVLHDSVVKSVAYDYASLMTTDCFDAHSVVGAFLHNKAVCEGIAKAFKLLCNEYGIKCIVVLGKADPKCVFDEKSYHAWNLVKVGGESYHVDPTWDNMCYAGSEHISYDYFNVTTADILKDHRPRVKLPLCTSNRLNYFACTKSYVSTYAELVKLIKDRISSKMIMFKALNDKGEFKNIDEIRTKTYTALRLVMSDVGMGGKFSLTFNDVQSIGKILFLP